MTASVRTKLAGSLARRSMRASLRAPFGGSMRAARVVIVLAIAVAAFTAPHRVTRAVAGVTASHRVTGAVHAACNASGTTQVVQVQLVLDTSASVPERYREDALAAVANVIAEWPQPLPTQGASLAQSGLSIEVRGVDGDSYAPDALLAWWTLPGIAAVPALPKTITPQFTRQVVAYRSARSAAQTAYRRALRCAGRAAQGLRSLHPATTYASEIEGAVSAAAQSFSPGGVHLLIVVSDLAQNRRPQIAGRLAGSRVLVAHLCWRASTCISQEAAWGKRLRSRGAVAVNFVRIERFPSAVATFMKGK